MKILAIQSSPNTDGLTGRLAQAVLQGAAAQGAETELVHLNRLQIEACQACGTGWGHHFKPQADGPQADECILQDDFAGLHTRVATADGLIFCTPVYFHDLSESAKVFLDRLRRCHWPLKEKSPLRGKGLVSVTAAGGTGNGALEAAVVLEKILLSFLGMKRIASLAVTRFNQEFQVEAGHGAGRLMVQMLRNDSSAG